MLLSTNEYLYWTVMGSYDADDVEYMQECAEYHRRNAVDYMEVAREYKGKVGHVWPCPTPYMVRVAGDLETVSNFVQLARESWRMYRTILFLLG